MIKFIGAFVFGLGAAIFYCIVLFTGAFNVGQDWSVAANLNSVMVMVVAVGFPALFLMPFSFLGALLLMGLGIAAFWASWMLPVGVFFLALVGWGLGKG